MKKEKVYSTELHLASKSKYYKKKVIIEAIISGKTLLPYYAPKEIELDCALKARCRKVCCIKEKSMHSVDFTHPDFIKFVGISDTHIKNIIKSYFDIPYRCDIKVDIKEVYNVEELFLSSIVSSNKNSNVSSVSRLGYFVGHGIETNVPYELECFNVPEPIHNKVVHIITKADKLKTNIDYFEITAEIYEKLKIFQPVKKTSESIYDKLTELYNIYSKNLTKIYNRFDLHMAIDLIFHSPLSFYLGNEYVHKGWGDALVIGDTRCGKGFVAEGLCRYYNIGELVSGENLSFAGLVGGVQQMNNRWVSTWGKIPLNDRQLVIIDEAAEIDKKEFARLSRIRSEGIAEIIKIQSEKTMARTRLIFLANPQGRTISSYSFGIQAISDIIDNPEDISRFDYALIVANDEVSLEDINKKHEMVNNPYEELDRALILWCWSRKPKQIKITSQAQVLILDLSIKLGRLYDSSIPLIQGENIRVKLAKIAIMIAARVFSNSNEGENILVDIIHVEAAYAFINMLYKKKCSSYYFYSQVKKQTASTDEYDKLEKYFSSFESKYDLIDYFISNNYITLSDISEHINQPKEVAREIISNLLKYRCILKKFTFYVKTQGFVEWLKKQSNN